jgi:hypothetical protein
MVALVRFYKKESFGARQKMIFCGCADKFAAPAKSNVEIE